MKKLFCLFSLLFTSFAWSQTDFSNSWEDFFSYNNVKDFIKVEDKIYAIVDNAVFTYDVTTSEVSKISSIQGLSGKTTSSIYYSKEYEKLIIGYQTGLIEIIDNKGKITISNDIERLSITGSKQINDISAFGNKLFLATPFAIIVYDIEKLQFGDTYFIGNNSSEVAVNQITIFNDNIYAATEMGVFIADVNNNSLIDFNNWQQPQGSLMGSFKTVKAFNNKVYASSSTNLYELINNTAQLVTTTSQEIIDLNTTNENITVSMPNQAIAFNTSLTQVASAETTIDNNFNINTALAENQQFYLGTKEKGILLRDFSTLDYTEIHPEGPSSNQVFSITAQNNNLWVVYGGYDDAFVPLGNAKDVDHFNGAEWANIPFNDNYPARDLVNVTIDPENQDKAYISSFSQNETSILDRTGGMLVVENNIPVAFWNQTNSGLESLINNSLPDYKTIRINVSAFDNQGNLWLTNSLVANNLKKLSPNGEWTGYDLNSIMPNKAKELTDLVIDRSNTVWIGTRRNGLLAFNETGLRKKALNTEATKGSLPDPNVRSVAIDRNNRVWIGTPKGLVIFTGGTSLFDTSIYDARPVVIEDDGVARRLLGDQVVNTIAIDGADNKWFGTATGGVLGTNPSGQETLFNFNKDNSPLPSNKIVKIKVDDSNGKVYFATDKGIVAFKNNVAPFGDGLGEVYAYPNPVKKEHSTVTIDGRKGRHLPRGTNVKILDAAGRLVYETNVIEGQELKGGKVIWDKTNLAGRKVASGVYIVLLTLPDATETSATKIAIIN